LYKYKSLCNIILDVADLKTGSTTIANDKIANYTNGSMIVEIKNIKTNQSDDSSDHVDFPSIKKTNSAPSSDKELDDYYDVSIYASKDSDVYSTVDRIGNCLFHYIRTVQDEWRPWYVIHESLERNEPQSSHEQRSKSSIDDLTTDDFCKNYSNNNVSL